MGTNSAQTAYSSSVIPSVSNAVASYNEGLDRITQMRQDNNAWSAMQADYQRQWQEKQNQIAMDFNAAEAAKNRDWQKMMSDTAHQREIADLKAAGLNPILSAMGGNGAAVTSGATASGVTSAGAKGDTDTSASQAMVGLLSGFLQSQTQLAVSNNNAIANLAIADKYNAMSKYTADLQSQTQLNTASISAIASRYAADVHADATKVSAAIHAAAQKYGYDINSMTQKQIAGFNGIVNMYMQQAGFQHDFDIREQYPNNAFNFLGSVGAVDDIKGLMDFIGSNPLSITSAQGRENWSNIFKGLSAFSLPGAIWNFINKDKSK